MRSPLDPETQLDVHLSAICARNQYTRDPAAVLAELTAAAGARGDILARAAGTWSGYFDSPATHVLAAALATLPGAAEWVAVGRARRGAGSHSAPGGAR